LNDMLEALRAQQRTRLKVEGMVSHSFLPRRPRGPQLFTPFRAVTCCLDTSLAPSTRTDRQAEAQELVLLVALAGTLSVSADNQPPIELVTPAALAAWGESRSLEIRNPGEKPARYLDLALELPTELQGPAQEVRPADLRLIPIPVGAPFAKFVPLISAMGHEGAVASPFPGAVHFGRLRAGESLIFETSALRSALCVVTHGLIQSGKYRLLDGDQLMAQGESELSFSAVQGSRFLLVDLE
jgi:redox-sensitive bicupin YhaK (pirin superfamily)